VMYVIESLNLNVEN